MESKEPRIFRGEPVMVGYPKTGEMPSLCVWCAARREDIHDFFKWISQSKKPCDYPQKNNPTKKHKRKDITHRFYSYIYPQSINQM